MTKRQIGKWWIAGLVVMLPGGVLIPASILALLAHLPGNGSGAYQWVGDAYSVTMVSLMAAGCMFGLVGIVLGLIAAVGAMGNVNRLPDRRWFQFLLWGVIIGVATTPLFGVGGLVLLSVMIAYLVAGPDAVGGQAQSSTPSKRTINSWTARGFAVVGAGMVLALVVANLTYPDRPFHGQTLTALAIEFVGIYAACLGFLLVAAAWWGAFFNSYRLADRSWFKAVLWSGVAGALTAPLFGFGGLVLAVILIVYGIWAPDGAVTPSQTAIPAAPTRYAPTS